MIFTRMSSRLLFLRTAQHRQLEEYLKKYLCGKLVAPENALAMASEDSSLVFITPPGLRATRVEDALSFIHVPYSTSVILMRMINDGRADLLEKAQLGPALLLMRIPEEGQSIIDRLREEYCGSILSLSEGIGSGESEDTLIVFTNGPINRYTTYDRKDLPFLLVNVPIAEMQKNIRRDAVRYITQSLADTEWYEYRINIYDAYGHYMQHLERLMLAFSDLELGLVLAQRWTRDHALVLYSVTAYQVRIFSLIPPKKLKKLLIGLEFDHNGSRFVDMDLYYRNKKIEFSSLDIENRKKGRQKLAATMRDKILAEMSEDTLQKFLDVEEKLSNRGY